MGEKFTPFICQEAVLGSEKFSSEMLQLRSDLILIEDNSFCTENQDGFTVYHSDLSTYSTRMLVLSVLFASYRKKDYSLHVRVSRLGLCLTQMPFATIDATVYHNRDNTSTHQSFARVLEERHTSRVLVLFSIACPFDSNFLFRTQVQPQVQAVFASVTWIDFGLSLSTIRTTVNYFVFLRFWMLEDPKGDRQLDKKAAG
ncbi:hypothetical protein C8Q75DRAFT_100703 [Abortiporus biennis]|nr:hypothetical protein C8Q75DRAFT_100703 [Abortiporus biennis]